MKELFISAVVSEDRQTKLC